MKNQEPKKWEKELKKIYKGLISEGLAVVEYGKVKRLFSKVEQQAKKDVLKKIEGLPTTIHKPVGGISNIEWIKLEDIKKILKEV